MEGEAQEGSRRNDAESEGPRRGKGCISVQTPGHAKEVQER